MSKKTYEIGIQNHEYGFMRIKTDLDPASDEFNELVDEAYQNGECQVNKNEYEWEIQAVIEPKNNAKWVDDVVKDLETKKKGKE